MPHNPDNAPSDAEVAEVIDRHKLPITNRTYDGLVAYQKLLNLAVQPAAYSPPGSDDSFQEIRLTDESDNQAFGLSDNIHRSFVIAMDRYLSGEYGRYYH